MAIGDCRVSIIDCQLAFCLLAQLFINLLEIRYIHMVHICIGYLYIYVCTLRIAHSWLGASSNIIHGFAHFDSFILLKVACIFECSFSHVCTYTLYIYSVYLTYCRTQSQFISIKILQLANGLFAIEIFLLWFFFSMQLCVPCGIRWEWISYFSRYPVNYEQNYHGNPIIRSQLGRSYVLLHMYRFSI